MRPGFVYAACNEFMRGGHGECGMLVIMGGGGHFQSEIGSYRLWESAANGGGTLPEQILPL